MPPNFYVWLNVKEVSLQPCVVKALQENFGACPNTINIVWASSAKGPECDQWMLPRGIAQVCNWTMESC